MTPTQAASYFCLYHKLVASCTAPQLQDVYGFLVSGTAPLAPGHPYGRFIALEDRFAQELSELKAELKTGVPYVKDLLSVELGFGDDINPAFYELISASREE